MLIFYVKMIPKFLTFEQKEFKINIGVYLLNGKVKAMVWLMKEIIKWLLVTNQGLSPTIRQQSSNRYIRKTQIDHSRIKEQWVNQNSKPWYGSHFFDIQGDLSMFTGYLKIRPSTDILT